MSQVHTPRRALVTGGSGDLGGAIAQALAWVEPLLTRAKRGMCACDRNCSTLSATNSSAF